MTRAEERALEAYPELLSGSIFGPLPVDLNKACREKFQEGYEQAEKDLGLTWKDIDIILKISADMLDDRENSPIGLEKEWCQQVLRIFNLKKHE